MLKLKVGNDSYITIIQMGNIRYSSDRFEWIFEGFELDLNEFVPKTESPAWEANSEILKIMSREIMREITEGKL